MAKYIKIPTNFFESETIKEIETKENADAVILLYLELLCAAYEENRKGEFKIAQIELTDTVLSNIFGYVHIGAKLELLESYHLIKREPKSIKVFKFWQDKHNRESPHYKEWRMAVFKRDQFQCQKCGTKGDLQAHHIKPWKDCKRERYDVSNGITLCRKCHLEAHGGSWK